MDGWEERNSQPPDVNRCPICGLTDCCLGHGEFDVMVKTMALIDDVLAKNPRAKRIVDEAYRKETP